MSESKHFRVLTVLALVVTATMLTACGQEQETEQREDPLAQSAEIIIEVAGESNDPVDQAVITALGTLGQGTVVKEASASDMMVLLEKDGSVSLVLPAQEYRRRLRPEVFSMLLYHEMVHLAREHQGVVDHSSKDSWMAGELAANEAQVKFTWKLLAAGYPLDKYQNAEEENLLGGEQGFLVDLELYKQSPDDWRQMIQARYERAWTSLQETGRGYQAP